MSDFGLKLIFHDCYINVIYFGDPFNWLKLSNSWIYEKYKS